MHSDLLNARQPPVVAEIQFVARTDSEYREVVTSALQRRGHHTTFAALPVAPSTLPAGFDLLVLEPDAGDPDALRLCRAIRQLSWIPLLVIVPLTARSRGIQALDQGADSFILAPFDRRELVARCEALIRRYRRW